VSTQKKKPAPDPTQVQIVGTISRGSLLSLARGMFKKAIDRAEAEVRRHKYHTIPELKVSPPMRVVRLAQDWVRLDRQANALKAQITTAGFEVESDGTVRPSYQRRRAHEQVIRESVRVRLKTLQDLRDQTLDQLTANATTTKETP
jgi:vacuolar-type H+-ATPase subunit I/STV1